MVLLGMALALGSQVRKLERELLTAREGAGSGGAPEAGARAITSAEEAMLRVGHRIPRFHSKYPLDLPCSSSPLIHSFLLRHQPPLSLFLRRPALSIAGCVFARAPSTCINETTMLFSVPPLLQLLLRPRTPFGQQEKARISLAALLTKAKARNNKRNPHANQTRTHSLR